MVAPTEMGDDPSATPSNMGRQPALAFAHANNIAEALEVALRHGGRGDEH